MYESRGEFFASISCEDCDPDEIFEKLRSYYYYGSQNMRAMEVLESSLVEAGVSRGVAVASVIDNVCYVASFGQSEVILVRGGQEIVLAKNGEPVSLSGRIKEGDVLIIRSGQGANVTIDVGVQPQPASLHAAQTSFLKSQVLQIVDTLLELIKRRELHLGHEHDFKRSRGKRAVIVGIALLLILVVSVIVGMKRREVLTLKGEVNASMAKITNDLEMARSWKGLKDEDAKILLLRAREEVLALEKANPASEDVRILKTSVEESLGDIAGIYKIKPNLFLDLALVSANLTVSKMVVTEENLFVFDKDQKRLVKINLLNKKTEVVAGPDQLEGVSDIAAYSDRVFLVKDEGIFEASNGKKQISKDWNGEILISTFAGNLYILDKSESEIYRYGGAAGGFSAKSPWLATDVTVDFSDAKSWVIDGSIWVRGQHLRKFSLGKSDFFNQTQVPEPSTAFATDEESPNLYFLNPEKSNVVILSKKGEFNGVYEDEMYSLMKDIVISHENEKIILSNGQKLYDLSIK